MGVGFYHVGSHALQRLRACRPIAEIPDKVCSTAIRGVCFCGALSMVRPREKSFRLGDRRMSASAIIEGESFIDRRGPIHVADQPLFERRQFANSYDELSPDA